MGVAVGVAVAVGVDSSRSGCSRCGSSRRCRRWTNSWCRRRRRPLSTGKYSHVINVFFVLPPARVEVESGRISDITSGVVRNDGDVIADLVLVRIAFEWIKRIAHRDVRRPGNAGVGAIGIE